MAFKDIIGHEKIIGRLKKALEKNEFASAYLFFGDEAIGKRLAAINFAKAMNCLSNTMDGCDECISCSKIKKGIHPDVRIIAPEAEMADTETNAESKGTEKKSRIIKIDQIKAIQGEMAYSPFEGKKRVFIIDNADKMNTEAANSLLKTLEEPARNSIIILVSSKPNFLLPTIVSRCQQMRFTTAPIETVKRLLIEKGINNSDADLIASAAHGRIGIALNTDASAIKEKRDEYLNLLSAAVSGNTGNIFLSVEKYAKDSNAAMEIFEWFYIWLRDVIIFKETGETRYLTNSDRLDEIKKWAEINTTKYLDILKSITDIQKAFSRNINKQLAMEKVMMEIKEVAQK